MKQLPKFYNIQDIVREYDRTSQGHFFSPDTMSFFKSRLTSHFRQLSDTEYLFITTEKRNFGNTTRCANLRLLTIIPDDKKFCGYNMRITPIGESMVMTLARAKTAMKNYKKD